MNRPPARDAQASAKVDVPADGGLTLRQAAAQLRQQPADPGVQEAVFAAVEQAARSEQRQTVERAPLGSWLGFGLAAGMVVASVAALVLHASQRQLQVIEREHLIDLALEHEEPEQFEFDLNTDQHDADHRVRIEAPAHVQVSLHPERPSLAPRCGEDTCIHEFARDENTASRVRLTVSRPGNYPVRVHHDSAKRSVRQDVLLRAR